MGYTYGDFKKDNFTANESDYYMFRKVDASLVTGLLELGELTCDHQEEAILTNIPGIAENLAHALQFLVTRPVAVPSHPSSPGR